jgi:hypothetical protein
MKTPWGKSDSETKFARGVTWVGTPGHGGFMISKGVAKSYLTEAAQKRGFSFGGYLAYEEDCDYALVSFEHPELFPELKPETVFHSLSAWSADYLIERGITPEPEGYAFYLENKEMYRLRAEKSPDLVVSASGDWADWVPKGKVGIHTADGKKYLADAGSYQDRFGLNLLSKLTGVKPVEERV